VAIASCPKCATKLKVPDGTTASVRCPKCQTVFKSTAPPAAAPAPEFEVVEETPAKPAPLPTRPAKPAAPPPPPPPAPAESPFSNLEDEDDRPRKKRRRDDDEDEDDRPRKKKSRDDDEDEDRPRSKKKNRDDDEDEDDRPRKKKSRDDDEDDDRPKTRKRDDDEDDDRPRKKKSRRDDEDEDDEDDRPRKKASGGSAFGLARVGVLLVLISLGLYLGAMGLQLLFLGIAVIGGVIPSGMSLLTGLVGLANWIVGLTGLGLCIAGPSRARGLAIAATSVAAVHLILGFVVVNDSTAMPSPDLLTRTFSLFNRAENAEEIAKEYSKEMQKNPGSARAKELAEELKSISENQREDGNVFMSGSSSKSKMRWGDLATSLNVPDHLIAVIAYDSKSFSDYLLGLFWGLTEIARLILLTLMLGSLGGAAKDHQAESKAKMGWIAAMIASGVGLILMLIVSIIFDGQKKDAGKEVKGERSLYAAIKSPLRTVAIGEFLCLGLHAASLAMPALAALSVYGSSGSGRPSPNPSGGSKYKKRTRRKDDDDDDDDDD